MTADDIITRARSLSAKALDSVCGFPHTPADWIDAVTELADQLETSRDLNTAAMDAMKWLDAQNIALRDRLDAVRALADSYAAAPDIYSTGEEVASDIRADLDREKPSVPESLVTARVVVTQTLPDGGGDPEITVDATDGHGGELPVISTLGLLSFATADQYSRFPSDDEEA